MKKNRYTGRIVPGLVHPVENGDAFILGEPMMSKEHGKEIMCRVRSGETVNIAAYMREHGIEDPRDDSKHPKSQSEP
jgi:hypothetical protein